MGGSQSNAKKVVMEQEEDGSITVNKIFKIPYYRPFFE